MRQRRKRRADAPSPDRLVFIEGMRGLAALYVVLGHFCSMADPRAFQHERSYAPLWLQNVMAPFWQGHLAVAAFIAISGFCLQMSLFQGRDGSVGSLKRFFARRARRILPPYYACLALSIVVALTVTVNQPGMPFEQYLPVDSTAIWTHVLLIHNFSPQWMYKINGVLWSISAEAQLYILFPLLVWMVAKVGRNLSVLATGIACAAILFAFPNTLKLYPWYLALFTIGIAAAHAAYRPVPSIGVMPRLAFLAFLLCAGACVVAVLDDLALPISDALGATACAALLYVGCVNPFNPLTRLLSIRPLGWLGAISYSLYLMHHPIEQVIYAYRPTGIQGEAPVFLYLLAAGLPLILLGCTVFWFLFERPFVRRLRSSARQRPSHGTTMPVVAYVEDRAGVTVGG